MLKNYLKIAVRNLRRHKGYTAINVLGLSVGLACCFLIALFIQHERAFDRFHKQAGRVYRITYADEDGHFANSAAGFAPALKDAFPEIERAVRVEQRRQPYLEVDGQHYVTEDFTFAGEDFFNVFDGFKLLRGDPETALQKPRSLVLTERAARRLKGENPIGRTVGYGDRFDLTVTGVMANVPAGSHLQFDYVVPFELIAEFGGADALTDFTNYNYFTYVLLKPGTDPKALERKATALLRERFGAEAAQNYHLVLQPLTGIHFDTSLRFDVSTNRSARTLYIFGAVGLFILLIACANFMNLATARAGQRAREVGVRKSVGAHRLQLVGQFLSESVLLSVVAIALAAGLTRLLLPIFNGFMGSAARLGAAPLSTAALLTGIGLAAGMLAGSYPALYLSAFQPARVLKGEFTQGRRAAGLRRSLVVFQFALSVLLIVATLTTFQQLRFMQTKSLGFDGEQVVYFEPPATLWNRYEAFRQEILKSPEVLSVAKAGGLPGRTGTNRGYSWPGQNGEEQGKSFWTIPAGPGYIETMSMELIAGRGFSRAISTDTLDTYVLNETAVKALGWSVDEAIGHSFRAWDRPRGTVIGVVRDFHFQSMHQQIEPVVLNYIPWFSMIAVRLAPGAVPVALEDLRAQWSRFAPGYAFDYEFLDKDFGRLYRAEAKLGQLFGFLAAVAIFIACLGLFGLAAFAAEQRTKEIGIRKVLGASVSSIVVLLSKDFAKLVLVAFVIAAPLAYFAMQRWLADFAYRIALGPGVFLLAGAAALFIALATVSYQALKAARKNPTEALRSE